MFRSRQRFVTLGVLGVLLLLTAPLRGQEEYEVVKAGRWRWTQAELSRIDASQKQAIFRDNPTTIQVKIKGEKVQWKIGSVYQAEGTNWIGETDVSARFAAELAVYMDLYEEMLRMVMPGERRTVTKTTFLALTKRHQRVGGGVFGHGLARCWINEGNEKISVPS